MEGKNVFFLEDLEDAAVDAVIITAAKREEIQEAIDETKRRLEGEWSWEEVKNAMPEGTVIIDKWTHCKVYY